MVFAFNGLKFVPFPLDLFGAGADVTFPSSFEALILLSKILSYALIAVLGTSLPLVSAKI